MVCLVLMALLCRSSDKDGRDGCCSLVKSALSVWQILLRYESYPGLKTVGVTHQRTIQLDFPIGGFSPPEGRLARGFKPPAFSRLLFQSAVKSAESFSTRQLLVGGRLVCFVIRCLSLRRAVCGRGGSDRASSGPCASSCRPEG